MNVRLQYRHGMLKMVAVAILTGSAVVCMVGEQFYVAIMLLIASNTVEGWRLRQEIWHWKSVIRQGVFQVVDQAAREAFAKKTESPAAMVREAVEKEQGD